MRRCVLLIWWFWVWGSEDGQRVGEDHGRLGVGAVVGGGYGLGCNCCKCALGGAEGSWGRLKLLTSVLKGKVEGWRLRERCVH